MENGDANELLTTDEAAQLLGLSRRTLEDWRLKRSGPPYHRISRSIVRYRRSDLLDWLERNRVKR
jgi:excisionase family DNA binding protein